MLKKTCFFGVTRKHRAHEFPCTINNNLVTVVSQQKYLGLKITSDLTWDSHINNITLTARKRLFFLKRCLRQAPCKIKLLAYNTLVRSVLEYATPAWFPSTNKLITIIEGVQRKAIRFIFNKYQLTDSPSALIKSAGLLTIENRAALARLKLLHQLIHNKLNVNSSKYISISDTRITRLKHSYTLNEYRFRTNCFKYSFFPLAIRQWNGLPSAITNTSSLTAFLSLLENYLRDAQT